MVTVQQSTVSVVRLRNPHKLQQDLSAGPRPYRLLSEELSTGFRAHRDKSYDHGTTSSVSKPEPMTGRRSTNVVVLDKFTTATSQHGAKHALALTQSSIFSLLVSYIDVECIAFEKDFEIAIVLQN